MDIKPLPISTRLLPLWVSSLVQVFTLLVLVYLGWYAWFTYNETGAVRQRNNRMLELVSMIRHHDVALTMSAQMAAATGDLQWAARYREFAPELDDAFVELQRLAEAVYEQLSEPAQRAEAANTQLVAMEERALQSVQSGELESAMDLLFSEEYDRQKEAYSAATDQIMAGIADYVQDREEIQYRRAVFAVILVLIALPLEIILWIVEVRSIRRAVE